jgi:guanylate kinase
MGVGLHALIGTHAVAIANSGVGKSGLLRKLLETTNGRVQQLVLDPEDKL